MAKNVNKVNQAQEERKLMVRKMKKIGRMEEAIKEELKGSHDVLIARRQTILRSIVGINLECSVEFANGLAILTRCARIRVNY